MNINFNLRVAKLEDRMDKIEMDLSGINSKLDAILSISTAAKHTGNFVINNIPRIIGGIIAGLTSFGVIEAAKTPAVSTFLGM